jgi:hypothetical protein
MLWCVVQAYVAMLDEVQRQFSKEFDYTREARDQETVRKELQRVSTGPFYCVGKARAGWHSNVPGQGVRPPLCSSPSCSTVYSN